MSQYSRRGEDLNTKREVNHSKRGLGGKKLGLPLSKSQKEWEVNGDQADWEALRGRVKDKEVTKWVGEGLGGPGQ